MSWTSGLVKLVLGFVIAITLLVSGSVALALIFINRASSPPPKPIFANDSSAVKKAANILNQSLLLLSPIKHLRLRANLPLPLQHRGVMQRGLHGIKV